MSPEQPECRRPWPECRGPAQPIAHGPTRPMANTGPDSFCGALSSSCGILLRPVRPWFVLKGPDSSCDSLIRLEDTSSSRCVLLCPGGLLRTAGIGPCRMATKPDRESTSVWGPSWSMAPALVWGGGGQTIWWPPMICFRGNDPNAATPCDPHWFASDLQLVSLIPFRIPRVLTSAIQLSRSHSCPACFSFFD